MSSRRFILYGRSGCHLCERLEALALPHLQAALAAGAARLDHRDIDADDNWRMLYGDRIPVLTCDGRVLLEGRPEAPAVAAAIHQALVG